MWRGAFLFFVACGGGNATLCPTVEQLRAADDFERRENAVVVERCRADGWSKEVVDCLVQETDREKQDRCFKKLSKNQQAKLHEAFEPLGDELDAQDAKVLALGLREDVAMLKLDELVARAPRCADYAAAVKKTADAIMRCKHAELEAFGVSQLSKRDTKELGAITDPQQLATECATRMEHWRNAYPTDCKR